ncbi:MAG: DUF5666 domain-containing protein [Thiolinea sp.]
MFLKRAALSAVTCCLLSACMSGDLQLSEGGIGGTGIAFGTITGFGSIWVNGVRYDVSNASFTRDGASASGQGDYRIGEVVTINGSVNADGVSGTASSVEFDDLLEGPVSTASTDGSTISILGQTVRTDAHTVLHGFAALQALQAGNVVEVSGYRVASEIRATSITLKQSTFTANQSMLEVKGTVGAVDLVARTFVLGQWLVDYTNASLELPGNMPQTGQYVEVKSAQAPQGNRLLATEVELEDERPVFGSGAEVELEGIVTAFTSSVQFSVNGQPVITNASTRFKYGIPADVQLNTQLEVEGTIDANGVLVAEEVSLQQRSESDSSELEGRITALNAATQEIMLSGMTIVVDSRTSLVAEINDRYVSLQFADLRVNDLIEVDGSRLNDGRILALKIERKTDEQDEQDDD